MHILEIAFSDAYGALAERCGTSAAFEETLAVLIYSEGKKRLRHGLDLRGAYDAVAIANIAVQHFSRSVSTRSGKGNPTLASPSAVCGTPFGQAPHGRPLHASPTH